MKNTSIKCEVESCRFNNENFCSLNQIKVSCNCDKNTALKEDSICDSFKKR